VKQDSSGFLEFLPPELPRMSKEPPQDPLLRLIALFKLAKSILFFCAGIGFLHFLHKDVEARLQLLMDNLHVDSDNHLARWVLEGTARVTSFHFMALHGVALLSAVAFFYSFLFGLEGIGLYLRKAWGEWMVIIITGSLLPLEIYEIAHHVTVVKVLFSIANLIILGYLISIILKKRKA
jgi:uncharacterized membrane protein (DUF2068 family)